MRMLASGWVIELLAFPSHTGTMAWMGTPVGRVDCQGAQRVRIAWFAVFSIELVKRFSGDGRSC